MKKYALFKRESPDREDVFFFKERVLLFFYREPKYILPNFHSRDEAIEYLENLRVQYKHRDELSSRTKITFLENF